MSTDTGRVAVRRQADNGRSEYLLRIRTLEGRRAAARRTAGEPTVAPFATREAVREYLHESPRSIRCLLCQRWFRMLAKHLTSIHDMTAREYKVRFGLPVGAGLVCSDAAEAMARKAAEARRWDSPTWRTGPNRGGYTQAPYRVEELRAQGRARRIHPLERTCAHCGIVFEGKFRQRFCTLECFNALARKRKEERPKRLSGWARARQQRAKE